jgi:hypothetical protein
MIVPRCDALILGQAGARWATVLRKKRSKVVYRKEKAKTSKKKAAEIRSILANAALMSVLVAAASSPLEPELFGVRVSAKMLWLCLGLAHVYFCDVAVDDRERPG